MIDIEQGDDCQMVRDAAVRKLQTILDEADHPLLLLSGGSSISVASKLLKDSLGLNRWSLGQVDERFGLVDHQYSNWKALKDKGLDASRFRQVIPILSDGLQVDKTAKIYEQQLRHALEECDVSVALLGLGADSHIAGILPKDKEEFEAYFQGESLVTHFKGPDFERITITQSVLNSLDYVVVYSCGNGKWEAVRKLDDDLPVNEHPAQMLKYAQSVTVFAAKEENA